MLRKRTRSHHNKDQMEISDASGTNVKYNPNLNAPLLFVGLGGGSKGVLDSDSVRSPTSPLDFTLLSNLGNPFRTPKSSSLSEGQQRSWDCSKVGLGIIDSLEDCSMFCSKILLTSENKKPTLTPQMIIKTPNCKTYVDSVEASKSLPKDFCKLPYTKNGNTFHKGESGVLFEIGESVQEHEPLWKTRSISWDSFTPIDDVSGLAGFEADLESKNFASNQISSPPHFIGGSRNSNTLLPTELTSSPVSTCSCNEFMKLLSASEIELSEDYTCVISHGPNPKTTHIFCDCILETHSNGFKSHCKNEQKEKGVSSPLVNRLQTPYQYPSSDFLTVCYNCKKKLEEGEDIYIYRGEKSFCSVACRHMEIMIDEELEESNPSSENSPKFEFGGEPLEPGIPTAA